MAKQSDARPRNTKATGAQVTIREHRVGLVTDLWRGDVPLVMTWWVFGVVVGICFTIAYAFIEYQMSGLSEGLGPVFIIGFLLTYFAYVVFINVAVWRSAGKYRGPKHWAILAKVMVLVSWTAVIREAWQLFSVSGG